jgi:hypothetical protein
MVVDLLPCSNADARLRSKHANRGSVTCRAICDYEVLTPKMESAHVIVKRLSDASENDVRPRRYSADNYHGELFQSSCLLIGKTAMI